MDPCASYAITIRNSEEFSQIRELCPNLHELICITEEFGISDSSERKFEKGYYLELDSNSISPAIILHKLYTYVINRYNLLENTQNIGFVGNPMTNTVHNKFLHKKHVHTECVYAYLFEIIFSCLRLQNSRAFTLFQTIIEQLKLNEILPSQHIYKIILQTIKHNNYMAFGWLLEKLKHITPHQQNYSVAFYNELKTTISGPLLSQDNFYKMLKKCSISYLLSSANVSLGRYYFLAHLIDKCVHASRVNFIKICMACFPWTEEDLARFSPRLDIYAQKIAPSIYAEIRNVLYSL